ncbi:MAG: methionine ABC transporter ATP-binding protein, partial [Alphaproteobacteria bacterium]|nr:methionine ABC transporter ATP-binding protein [Alphaproteobacteria bacterium]
PVDEVIRRPRHPYSQGLMASIPSVRTRVAALRQIDGAMPRLDAMPPGCAFHPRCPHCMPRCRTELPELAPAGATAAACFLIEQARSP